MGNVSSLGILVRVTLTSCSSHLVIVKKYSQRPRLFRRGVLTARLLINGSARRNRGGSIARVGTFLTKGSRVSFHETSNHTMNPTAGGASLLLRGSRGGRAFVDGVGPPAAGYGER
jgi:hypothetical protein